MPVGWFRKLPALGVSLFLVSGDARALTVDFDYEFESSSDESAVRRWSDDALAQLPPIFHQRFSGTIRVRFRPWGNGAQLSVPYCSGGTPEDQATRKSLFETYGRYNAYRNIIYLNSRLIDEIRLGPQGTRGFDCYHGNFYRLATATLLHEIAHAYDDLDLDASISKSDNRSRQSRTTISTDPVWTVLDGFHTRLFGFRYPTAKNRDLDRLPSAHAARNKQESFAVHFEYFLLDPDYACRFPSHQEYFENHFGWSPARSDCRLNYEVVSQHRNGVAELDPARIYQVRYLLAAPGQAAESRLGHSMLHFVMCAPGTAIGPECLEQEEQHIVLGFAARTDDSPLRPIKGIVGSYDSMVFFTSLQHQLRIYNQFEMRDVISYLIDLSPAEIERLTNRAIELYWTYRGPYRIFTINCATETEDLLKAAILDEGYIYGSRRTPRGVLKRLQETGKAARTEAPIIYVSGLERGANALSSVYGVSPRNRKSLKRQVRKLSVDERLQALKRLEEALANAGLGNSVDDMMRDILRIGEQLESFRYVEQVIAHQQEEKLSHAGVTELKRAAKHDQDKEQLLERFRYLALTMQAGDRDARPGYGIPLVSEEGPNRGKLGRELVDVIQQILESGFENPRFLEWQRQIHETNSISRKRYRLLRAYADVARKIRTQVVVKALEEYPNLSNTALRVILDEKFGRGSFEPARFSDTRINNLRQTEMVSSRSTYD
jgi:hypothetical protein